MNRLVIIGNGFKEFKFRKFIFYQELQELEKRSSTAEGKVNLGIRPCIIYSTEL